MSKKTTKSTIVVESTTNRQNEGTEIINNSQQIEPAKTIVIPTEQQQQPIKSKVTSSESSIDIMQMLAKAQNSYVQTKDLADQPKPIGYQLNSNTYLKPEAIRIQPTTSPKSQEPLQLTKSQSHHQPINPIIQRLLSYDPNSTLTSSASTTLVNTSQTNDSSFNSENNNELLSLEIKRKLNIIKLPNDDNQTTPNQKLNIFSPLNNNNNNNKNLMTVKDFEANILGADNYNNLNESVANNNKPAVPPQQHQMFYLEQSTTYRPTKLKLLNENSTNDAFQKVTKLKHISSSNVYSLILKVFFYSFF